jgi:hypothetical protein
VQIEEKATRLEGRLILQAQAKQDGVAEEQESQQKDDA